MAENNHHQPTTFQDEVNAIRKGKPISTAVGDLLDALTNQERLSLLDGDERFWPGLTSIFTDRYNRVPYVMGEIKRLGIPGIRFTDGPRGIVMGAATAFPVSMARGATWDIDLERRVGRAIGKEGRALGANYFAGVCVNLPRHPAWGRIQETYSDDPLLLGEFGLALTQGVQEEELMACVKHFALNSMENARFQVDVQIAENVLHEVYLPHFRKIVEGGAASVMSAYNSVNGEWCGQSYALLTDILRNRWGFDGFVISDFIFGLRDAPMSVRNGLDVEAPFSQQRAVHLEKALETGELAWTDVDNACTRILSKQLQFYAGLKKEVPKSSVVFCNEHRTLAREVAQRSMVLLKNEHVGSTPVLPLQDGDISSIALLGRLANVANTGDHGSSRVFSPHVVTPYEGLKAALPKSNIVLENTSLLEKAVDAALLADIAICVVGYDHLDEGEYITPQQDPTTTACFPPPTAEDGDVSEIVALMNGTSTDTSATKSSSSVEAGSGGDRKSLRLLPTDVALIEAVTAANPRTIVVLVAAGAVIIEEWKEKAPAILMGWYAGSEGGHALADILLGRTSPSGHLPFSIPASEEHLPYFDMNAKKITYDRWHGQHLLDKLGVEAAFPFGFGLSYTTFAFSRIQAGTPDFEAEVVQIQVEVKNMGAREGRAVAQVYGLPGQSDFPKRVLLGFAPVDLQAGESKTVSVNASLRPLQRWVDGGFVLPMDEVTVEVAVCAGHSEATRFVVQLKK